MDAAAVVLPDAVAARLTADNAGDMAAWVAERHPDAALTGDGTLTWTRLDGDGAHRERAVAGDLVAAEFVGDTGTWVFRVVIPVGGS